MICCNGLLTPNYFYISRLRKVNEEAKNRNVSILDEHYKQFGDESKNTSEEMDGNKLKNYPLKRNLSMVNIGLAGHLFDTRCFNECIDICEKHEV